MSWQIATRKKILKFLHNLQLSAKLTAGTNMLYFLQICFSQKAKTYNNVFFTETLGTTQHEKQMYIYFTYLEFNLLFTHCNGHIFIVIVIVEESCAYELVMNLHYLLVPLMFELKN